MNTPLITWCLIVGILVIAIITQIVVAYHKRSNHKMHRHHFIEIGRERDEFFIPGDPTRSDDRFYNDYEDM